MPLRHLRLLPLFVAATLAGSIGPVRAEEGFWPFNALPREALHAKYGFEVSEAWLRNLQRSVVRFPAGSGALISRDGLVLTNHHIALWYLKQLSTPERDLVRDGFLAANRKDEIVIPGLTLEALVGIEDVSSRVDAAAAPDAPTAVAYAAQRAVIARIEEEALDEDAGTRGEVVALYRGALHHLYRYRRYTDVRLVFAPEFDVAFFGGDADNFTYPRYCLDFTLLRVYEKGEPAEVAHFLPVAPDGARQGDLVFTAGHPGSTQRLNTIAHLEYLRDSGIPAALRWLERRHAVLTRYASGGREQARQVKDEIFGVENSLKSLRGQLAGLRDDRLMGDKRERENRLRAAVSANPKLQKAYGRVWEAIATARQRFAGFAVEEMLLEGSVGFASTLFHHARTIVRLTAEEQKPDAERLPEYTEARRGDLERKLATPAPVYVAVERAKLADSLALLRETLGADHPVVRLALGGRSPEARAGELVGGTRLGNAEYRMRLVDGGPAAVAASDDPMIRLAIAVDPASRALRKRYQDEVLSVERDAYTRIARAVFATAGTGAYPDATYSLRLSFGAVRGYEEEGRDVAPFTTIAALFERAKGRGLEPPYRLPESWLTRQQQIDGSVPLNFVTTNDIVGGNSGSPVVDREGRLVGVVFDGNVHSFVGYFAYDADRNRAVSVDVRAILAALDQVYGARHLLDEILDRIPVSAAEP